MNRKLKAKIVEHFGTQWRFAEIMGENDSVVSLVVSGRRNISDEKKESWSKALRSDKTELFPG